MRRADTQVEKILLDYDENSVVTTYDQTANEKQTYKGVEVRQTKSDVEKARFRPAPTVPIFFCDNFISSQGCIFIAV